MTTKLMVTKRQRHQSWSKYLADFTYEHTDLRSFSTIDHFFTTERFLAENVLDAAPLHLHDCRSNHSPIMIKIKIPENVHRGKCKSEPIIKTSWKKADETDIEEYSDMLHSMLSVSPLPVSIACGDVLCQDESHSHDRDCHVVDLLEKITEASYECIPVIKIDQNKKKLRQLPGFKETVLPVKQDSLFWHNIWVSAGRPRKGWLFYLMKYNRAKYKYAVRQCKREANRLESEALGGAAEEGNKQLFKELRKQLTRKGSGQAVPDSLEGAVTKPDIIDKFRECYQQMYNCTDRSQQLEDIKDKIRSTIRGNVPASIKEINKINAGVVRAASEMMKPGKLDVSQNFSSDVFIHAPQILFDQLSEIFKSFLVHGTMPSEILACAFMPLWKGGLKDQRKFASYRALAGASQLLKIFEYTVLLLWGDRLSTDSVQFGFKKRSMGPGWLILISKLCCLGSIQNGHASESQWHHAAK